MIALAAALVLAAAPATGVPALAARVAAEVPALLPPGGARLAVHVDGVPALARALEVELFAALRERGLTGVRAPDEAAAREAGADALLDLRVGLDGGRLGAAGSLVSTRENFFTGLAVVRGGALQAAVPADDAARLLAGAAGTAARLRVDELLRVPAPVLAVAAGDLDGAAADEVAVLTSGHVIVAVGEARLAWELPPRDPRARASRDPVGGLAIRGREILWSVPSRGRAGRLRLERGELRVAGELTTLPLASGDAGLLTGSAEPGRNRFTPELRLAASADDPAPRAGTAPAPILAGLVAPGAAALGVVTSQLTFVPLDPDLRRSGAAVTGVGAAAALADLDGDGKVELVASGVTASVPDAVRVLRGGEVLLTSAVDASLTCGAAGDLDGDGRDDALLAGATAAGEGIVVVVHAGVPR